MTMWNVTMNRVGHDGVDPCAVTRYTGTEGPLAACTECSQMKVPFHPQVRSAQGCGAAYEICMEWQSRETHRATPFEDTSAVNRETERATVTHPTTGCPGTQECQGDMGIPLKHPSCRPRETTCHEPVQNLRNALFSTTNITQATHMVAVPIDM